MSSSDPHESVSNKRCQDCKEAVQCGEAGGLKCGRTLQLCSREQWLVRNSEARSWSCLMVLLPMSSLAVWVPQCTRMDILF